MNAPQLAPADIDVLQETLLGEALEYAPVGALVLDEKGHFLAVNRLACNLTGYARDEFLRLTPAELAADPTNIATKLAEMADGRLLCGETRLRGRDGSAIPVEYRVGATRSGGLPYFVLVFWEGDC